jgi:photosystem II stability/assembly factor-like uncharacterized protein
MASTEMFAQTPVERGMTTLLVAMRDAVVVVGRDGERWITEERFSGKGRLECIATDPDRPGTVYCGTSNDGLWRSDDTGGSWLRMGTRVLPRRVTAVAVSTAERSDAGSDVIYAGTEPSAFYRSPDGGAAWEERPSLLALPSAPTWSFPPRPQTHHVRWIAPDPRVPGRIFVAIEAGALVSSTDAGRSWVDRRPDGPYDTHTLVVHPHAPDRLYSAAGDGYFESRTGGATWERREDGLRHRYAWGLAVDPTDPETVVISAARSARTAHNAEGAESLIYRRTAGQPWRPISHGLPEPAGTTISVLAADPAEAGVVYAANNWGVYRSADMGEHWERLDIPWPARHQTQRVAGLALTTTQSN